MIPEVPGSPDTVPYEWLAQTRRAFPLLEDEDIKGAYSLLLDLNELRQRDFDARVDAEAEPMLALVREERA
jgi:hypothetical protein